VWVRPGVYPKLEHLKRDFTRVGCDLT
jgi:hypothetical protein